SIVPGNRAHNLRRLALLETNYADLSFLFTLDSGRRLSSHLGREALTIFETRHQTPYFFNLHVEDVGHTLVLGATGSGKSFFLNFVVAYLQRYAPKTLIFDLGGSYQALTRYFAGSALRLGIDRHDVTINPFSLPPTAENLHFLFGFVKVLIESGAQYQMSREDDRDLYEQIATLYALDPDQRRMFTLANILRRPLAQQLQPWIASGPYEGVFDNVEDTLTLARFQYIDFEGLEELPQLLEPLLFYLLHRADAESVVPGFSPAVDPGSADLQVGPIAPSVVVSGF